MADGQQCVSKKYSDAVNKNHPTFISDEWEAITFLHSKGYSVPKPIKKDGNKIYMQYIENGPLSRIYEISDDGLRQKQIKDFAKLLYDLHNVDMNDAEKPNFSRFVENELTEIRSIVEEHNLTDYLEILGKLEADSVNISEQPFCYIHRDYHWWNVLSAKDGKLYLVDFVLKQGDFRFDVGWTYMMMTRNGVSVEAEAGEFFLAEYINLKPDVRVNFKFFKQLANLRWLANVRPGEWSKKPDFWQSMIRAAESKFIEYTVV